MKKVLTIFILGILFLAPLSVFAGGRFVSGDLVVVGPDDVIDRSFFGAGERVEISGTVNGDVYAAGGEVLIDGTVNGDVLVAGGAIMISGEVTQDLRAVGGEINITGDINGGVSVVGGNLKIGDAAVIKGEVVLVGGNLSLHAPIESHTTFVAGNAVIASTVDGDVNAVVDVLRLTAKADVSGDLTYWSNNDASIDERAVVGGETIKKTPRSYSVPSETWWKAFIGVAIAAKVIGLLSVLLVGFLMVRFMPHYTANVVDNIGKKTWPSLGIGVVIFIVAPIASILLIITLVGLPLGLILLISYFIGLYLAKIFFMILLGELLLKQVSKKRTSYYGALVAGSILFTLVMLIPVINVFIVFFAVLSGIGGMAINEYQAYKKALKKKIV